jgi:hypothetical protein
MYAQAHETGTSTSIERWHSHVGATLMLTPQSMREIEDALATSAASTLTYERAARYN